jgi:tRNA (guanine37-N1)-methyltransferase
MFTQTKAKEYANKYEHLVLISGRYEGIDDRVRQILNAEEVSVGDYVLTGGELPSLTIVDATSRQIPGVLGTFESLEDKRPTNGETYTRPEVLIYKKKQYSVPEVLVGGDHKAIDAYRLKKRK